MGYNVNKMKKRAEELAEGYQDARDEAFSDEFIDMFMLTDENGEVLMKTFTEDDIQGFLDSFTFPDEGDWAFDAVQSELDEIGDQKYEMLKDERMGL